MRRLVFGLVLLAVCGTAAAQPPPPGLPSPRVQHVFPSGVKAGTTVEVTVTGTDVEEPEKLLFGHPNLKGEYIAPPKEGPPDLRAQCLRRAARRPTSDRRPSAGRIHPPPVCTLASGQRRGKPGISPCSCSRTAKP